MTRRAHIFATTALVIVAFSAQGQNNARLIPTMQELEGQIADLEAELARHEAALSDFRSAEESIQVAHNLEQTRAELGKRNQE